MKLILSHILVFAITFTMGAIFVNPFTNESQKEKQISKSVSKAKKEELPEQSFDSDKDESKEQPKLKSLSPYDIQSYIYNNPKTELNKIWQGLGIAEQYNGFYSDYKPSFMQICQSCSVETYEYNLDQEPEPEVLLKIADPLSGSSRYLIFKESRLENKSWKLIGFIDHDFPRYNEIQHSFLLNNGKVYLLIHASGATGTGISLSVDGLFTVRDDELVHLATYPAHGYESQTSDIPSVRYEGQINEIKIKKDSSEVKVKMYTSFDGVIFDIDETEPNISLFDKTQTKIYRKQFDANKKKLHKTNSDFFEKEIDSVNKMIGSLEEKEFLKQNIKELKRIANKKGTKKFRWLDEFLSRSPNSVEKHSLLKIMKN